MLSEFIAAVFVTLVTLAAGKLVGWLVEGMRIERPYGRFFPLTLKKGQKQVD